MQISFERRLMLMNPEFELKEKLTSDTIFDFLNSFTERFVRNNYLQEDTVADETRAQKKNADALKGLVVRKVITPTTADTANTDISSTKFDLPADYFLYIRSNSRLTKTYKGNVDTDDEAHLAITANKTIREDDVENILSTFYNKAILRNPYVVLNAGQASDTSEKVYLNVIHDTYTEIASVDVVYYRKPKRFDVIGVNGTTVLDHCELPENVHQEIVDGAVEMFITETKYRLNLKS